MSKIKKIYIAGPDVFRPDAKEIGEKYKSICRKYGFEGVFPLDGSCTKAADIFQWDVDMIEDCDIVIANLNPFRGTTMDDGTAFELGVAYTFCKKVYGYMSDTRSLRERYGEKDTEGNEYEDFNLPINLMIACTTMIIEGDFEDCVRVLANK